LLENLPPDEAGVYQDEVDAHLDPRLGLEWMNRGQQKQVVTPGQNEKRYLAGANRLIFAGAAAEFRGLSVVAMTRKGKTRLVRRARG